MEHIAIQTPERTFDDRETLPVLCRCSEKKIAPYGKVTQGDTVYFKLGDFIDIRATVSKVISKEYEDIGEIRDLCKGVSLYKASSFWDEMRSRRYATVVWLTNHEVLHKPIRPRSRSYGSGWIVLDSEQKKRGWLGLNN